MFLFWDTWLQEKRRVETVNWFDLLHVQSLSTNQRQFALLPYFCYCQNRVDLHIFVFLRWLTNKTDQISNTPNNFSGPNTLWIFWMAALFWFGTAHQFVEGWQSLRNCKLSMALRASEKYETAKRDYRCYVLTSYFSLCSHSVLAFSIIARLVDTVVQENDCWTDILHP